MAQTIRPASQEAVASGTTDVDICDAPAASKTRIVVAIRYTNSDGTPNTPIVKTKVGAAAAIERQRVADVTTLATEDRWCSRDKPYHLVPGTKLVGALTAAGAGFWLVEYLEMTDA